MSALINTAFALVTVLLIMLAFHRPVMERRTVVVGDWAQCVKADGGRGLCMTDDVNTRTSIANVVDSMQLDLNAAEAALRDANRALTSGSAAAAPTPSSTSFSVAAAVAPTPSSVGPLATAASKQCHPECTRRGTCNLELGRCDCPPFYTGADCSEPLFPACVKQWGLAMPVAPCGIHTQPAFPSSCECVWECHELGLDARQECLVEPKPGQTMAQAAADVKSRMGWMPIVANETWLRRTRADADASASDDRCSGHGILSVQLPYEFYPKEADCQPGGRQYNLEECLNQRVPKCRCFPGWSGAKCDLRMDEHAHLHKCLNDCSGQGTCVSNFCKCKPGIYGADCSLGGATPLRPTAPSTGLRPRVYVYDVPPRFTSWMGTFRRGDWTRDHWYGVDVMLHQQLLRSPYRTLDPEQADFFFIPLHLSLGFYSHRYDARRRLSRCLSR